MKKLGKFVKFRLKEYPKLVERFPELFDNLWLMSNVYDDEGKLYVLVDIHGYYGVVSFNDIHIQTDEELALEILEHAKKGQTEDDYEKI